MIGKKKKEPALFDRKECVGLLARFVKKDQLVIKRDLPMLYKLFKQYPSRKFWLAYDLGFQLNCMAWLLGGEGKEKIQQDWALFHLDLTPKDDYILSETKQGEDLQIEKKKNTLAKFLT